MVINSKALVSDWTLSEDAKDGITLDFWCQFVKPQEVYMDYEDKCNYYINGIEIDPTKDGNLFEAETMQEVIDGLKKGERTIKDLLKPKMRIEFDKRFDFTEWTHVAIVRRLNNG